MCVWKCACVCLVKKKGREFKREHCEESGWESLEVEKERRNDGFNYIIISKLLKNKTVTNFKFLILFYFALPSEINF